MSDSYWLWHDGNSTYRVHYIPPASAPPAFQYCWTFILLRFNLTVGKWLPVPESAFNVGESMWGGLDACVVPNFEGLLCRCPDFKPHVVCAHIKAILEINLMGAEGVVGDFASDCATIAQAAADLPDLPGGLVASLMRHVPIRADHN